MRWRRSLLILLLAASLALCGCRALVEDPPESISIYATFYPIYALTDALMADIPNASLRCLVQPQDGCLRRYALSDWDAYVLASSADAVIMGGRGLESFESTLFGWGEAGPAMTALLYNLELYNKSVAHAKAETDSHLTGANPHLYMSVDGAARIVESAAAVLMTLDPMYAETYAANESAALAALEQLREDAHGIVGNVEGKGVVLMNEALIYVAQDYGLRVADWIDRESGENYYETELADCLERLSRSGAKVVMIERQAPKALVDALEGAGYAVARIDILSTHREGEGFDGYIRAQHENATAIAQAFKRAEQEVSD